MTSSTPSKPQPTEQLTKKELEHFYHSTIGLFATDKDIYYLFIWCFEEARRRWPNQDDFNEFYPELIKAEVLSHIFEIKPIKDDKND